MHDPATQPRKPYLEEQFVRGTAAARSQITSNNSGKEDQAPTKVGRPTEMDPSRKAMDEYEKVNPQMAAEYRKSRMERAKMAEGQDGSNADRNAAQRRKEIAQDENSSQWEDSPRNKVG